MYCFVNIQIILPTYAGTKSNFAAKGKTQYKITAGMNEVVQDLRKRTNLPVGRALC